MHMHTVDEVDEDVACPKCNGYCCCGFCNDTGKVSFKKFQEFIQFISQCD